MHEAAAVDLVSRFTFVGQHLTYPVGFDCVGQPILQGDVPTDCFTRSRDGRAKEVETVDLLLNKYRWREKWSRAFLERRVETLLHRIVETRSTECVAEEVRRMVTEYEGTTREMTVLIPLVGVAMKVESLQLANVTLRNTEGDYGKAFTARCHSVIENNDHYDEAAKARIIAAFDEKYLAVLRSGACVEYSAVAEPGRAVELAIDEARHAVDLLRYALLFFRDGEKRFSVGIHGEVTAESRLAVCITTGNTQASYRGAMIHYPFEIDAEALAAMQHIGLFELSALFGQKQTNEFEKTILRAVHWLASAQAQFERENAFLNVISCVETFLCPPNGDPISATISAGVAVLIETEATARKALKVRLRELYSRRSGLSHGGSATVTATELEEATGIARELTVRMIARKDDFKSRKELQDWVEMTMLSG